MKTFQTGLGIAFGILIIVAGIYVFISEKRSRVANHQIDSLTTVVKLKENMAKVHENNAVRFQKEAIEWKQKANNLEDSITSTEGERLKFKKLYENSLRNPIHFTSDNQRDSIIAVLYRKRFTRNLPY